MFGFFFVGTVAATGYMVTGGMAAVEVDTADTDLNLWVPVRLVDLGLLIGRVALPAIPEEEWRHELDDLPADLSWKEIRPMLHDFAREVGDIPEGDLVTVRTENELVNISQKRGRFRIDVDTPDTKVKITLPKRAVERIAHKSLRLANAAM